jgi:hypothetical protein
MGRVGADGLEFQDGFEFLKKIGLVLFIKLMVLIHVVSFLYRMRGYDPPYAIMPV